MTSVEQGRLYMVVRRNLTTPFCSGSFRYSLDLQERKPALNLALGSMPFFLIYLLGISYRSVYRSNVDPFTNMLCSPHAFATYGEFWVGLFFVLVLIGLVSWISEYNVGLSKSILN